MTGEGVHNDERKWEVQTVGSESTAPIDYQAGMGLYCSFFKLVWVFGNNGVWITWAALGLP